MTGEIRVTVVATGFGKAQAQGAQGAQGAHGHRAGGLSSGMPGGAGTPVIPIDGARPRPVIGSAYSSGTAGSNAAARRSPNPAPAPERRPVNDLDDLEIPTFIRRQMD